MPRPWSGLFVLAVLELFDAKGVRCYRVMACNAGGCSGASAEASIVVQYPPSAAPDISVPAKSTNGSYTVTWTGIAVAERYLLEESVKGGGWVTVQENDLSARAFAGKPMGLYSYRVRAVNGSGAGPYSSTVSVNVIERPNPPSLSGPVADEANGYVLSWPAASGGGSHNYDLEKSTNGGDWVRVSYGGGLSGRRTAPGIGLLCLPFEGLQ
ncbi:fibronectin type III domain-containing protein [Stenotrophomonas sp. C1657]|nr:fibronectin type III domain-containing protein [Stenotrophomonas sp. C1657]MDV3513391.1 fibronectin type III domain-containing protein [Stenotrophomonas sp. C1657]